MQNKHLTLTVKFKLFLIDNNFHFFDYSKYTNQVFIGLEVPTHKLKYQKAC